MIKAIIVDDEQSSIDMLRHQVQQYFDYVEIVGSFNSGEQALAAMESLNPDLVFLDIEMPFMNGFEFLEKLGEINFDLIFVTAYNEFAIKAFKYSAIDYLLKPVIREDLVSAVERIKFKQVKISNDQVELLFDQMNRLKVGQKADRIALSTLDAIIFTRIDDIICCEGEANYTHVHLAGNKKVLVSKTMKVIQNLLPEKEFFRIHKGFLINMNHVVEYKRLDGGYVVMSNQLKVDVSKTKKEEFFLKFSKF
jgi:two-component system LytT family response regulator